MNPANRTVDLTGSRPCGTCKRVLVRPSADLCYFCLELHDAKAEVEKLRAQLAAERQSHGDLLAVIHGDGGHYVEEHGWEKAQSDAVDIVYKLKADRESMQIELRKIAFHLPVVAYEQADQRYVNIEEIFEVKRIAADACMLPAKPEVGD